MLAVDHRMKSGDGDTTGDFCFPEGDDLLLLDKPNQRIELLLSFFDKRACFRMVTLDIGPHCHRVALAVDQRRGLPELLLGIRKLTLADLQQGVDGQLDAFVVFELRFVVLLTNCEVCLRVGFRSLKMLDVLRDCF